jgi:hypothetical protein
MQLYKVVPVIRYSLSRHLFVINRSPILFTVQLFVVFISHWLFACFIVVQKCNSDPELCSGISIPLPVNSYPLYKKYLFSTSSSPVNKHHTADSTDFVLVQEAKEPITIIDKRDRWNQYTPHRQSTVAKGETVQYIIKCNKNIKDRKTILRENAMGNFISPSI